MENKIKKYLLDLEKERGIKILLACETGSRAWGFPSPDSDYDVRVIYKHDTHWYLSLTEEKDSIELFLDNNEVDISGWDIRKSLRLLWKSNPPLLERIQSPYIYSMDEEFVAEVKEIANETYSRIGTIHHYLSMATKIYAEISPMKDYKLKKFFYALRCSVACIWILEKEELPPIEFDKMLNGLTFPKTITDRIEILIKLKATISETYVHQGEKEIFQFMETCMERATKEKSKLAGGKAQMADLNKFFQKTILAK